MKLSFALFFLSQVTLCKAGFDNIAEEAQAVYSVSQIARELNKDITVVKDALAKASAKASPGSFGRRIEASSAIKNFDRQLKKMKKSKSNQCKADLAAAQEQIEELSKPSQPSLLGIQTAPTCRVERGSGPGQYKLISNTLAKDTFIFSDRPDTIEVTFPTDEFISDFDDIFEEVPPNVGLTFVENGNTVGPFVVIFEDAKSNGNEVTYDITQSKNQAGVLSMETIFGNNDSVDYVFCSYFIDNWFTRWITCPACRGVIPALIGLGSQPACDAGCAGILGAACFEIGGLPCILACIPLCAAIYGVIITAGAGAVSSQVVCKGVRLC